MERGPMALFGALVAVGIGPALWLGAQFGSIDVAPTRPPTVVSEQADKAPGGAGAAPEEPATEPTRHTRFVPLSGTPSARQSTSAPADAGEPDDQATTQPTTPTEPTETDDPTTPPTDSTTDPADPTDPATGGVDPGATQPPADEPVGGQAAGESDG